MHVMPIPTPVPSTNKMQKRINSFITHTARQLSFLGVTTDLVFCSSIFAFILSCNFLLSAQSAANFFIRIVARTICTTVRRVFLFSGSRFGNVTPADSFDTDSVLHKDSMKSRCGPDHSRILCNRSIGIEDDLRTDGKDC